MTNLSISNYGNYYTASAVANGVTVKNTSGTVIQPAKTAIKDVYTPSTTDTRSLAESVTYAPVSISPPQPPSPQEPSRRYLEYIMNAIGVPKEGQATYNQVKAGAKEDDLIAWDFNNKSWAVSSWDEDKQKWSVHLVKTTEGTEQDNNTSTLSGTSLTSFASLGKLLGIEDTITNKTSLLTSLDKLIAKESDELTKILDDKLSQAGLSKITKKITFAEDKDGNIVIEGKISAKQKRELAKLVNDDPELVERIKTQKARMEVTEGLKKDEVNLSDKKFDTARTQLLKDFLTKNGTTLEDIESVRTSFLKDGKGSEQYKDLYALLDSFPELNGEIAAYIERRDAPKPTHVDMPGTPCSLQDKDQEESTAVRSLLSIKRGVLAEASDEEQDFSGTISELRASIYKEIVDKYNKMYVDVEPSWQIDGFSMKFDSNGRLTITDVQTGSDDPKAKAQAEKVMNSWLTKEMKEAGTDLGMAILEAHDDEHGDVKEFRHEVIVGSGGIKILSPDADKAALIEMAVLTQDLGSALERFFGETMGIKSQFSVIFGSDGTLSLDKGALSSLEAESVKKVLEDVNRYLAAEKAGEDTEEILSAELNGIGEKLVATKDVRDKIHDTSPLPKEGTRFTI